MTTIENKLCNEGIHEILKFIGMQETLQDDLSIGNCFYCHSTIVITDKYRNVSGKVYELRPQVHHTELDGNQE